MMSLGHWFGGPPVMRVVRGLVRKIPQVMAEERISSLSSKVLYERLKGVISKLECLTDRCEQKTDLADFLIKVTWVDDAAQVSAEFEFGIKENWDQINVITMEDRLEALESVKRAFPVLF